MKTERWMEQYLKDGETESLLQKGAMQMYEATGGEKYLTFLKHAKTEEEPEYGSVLSFLYRMTGAEGYLASVEALKKKLKEEAGYQDGSLFYELGSAVKLEGMYRILPFYMEAETRYGKKEQYNHIIAQFDNVQQAILNPQSELAIADLEQTGFYMMALIDVMDAMSIEIYEQYRKLQDYYKALLKTLLPGRAQWSVKAALMIAYTMLKACRMNILLKEKYADFASELLLDASWMLPEDANSLDAGILMMAYAQSQMLWEELEDLE